MSNELSVWFYAGIVALVVVFLMVSRAVRNYKRSKLLRDAEFEARLENMLKDMKEIPAGVITTDKIQAGAIVGYPPQVKVDPEFMNKLRESGGHYEP